VILLFGFLVAIPVMQFPLIVSLLLFTCIALFVFFKYPRWLVHVLAACIPFQVEILLAQLSGARLSPQTLGAILLIFMFLMRGLLNENHSHKILNIPYIKILIVYLLFGSLAIAAGPSVTGFFQGIWSIYRTVWAAPLIYFAVWLYLKDLKSFRQPLVWLALSASVGSITAIVQTATRGQYLSGIGTNYRYLGFLVPLPPEVITSVSGKYIASLYLGSTNIYRGYGAFLTPNGFGVLLCITIFITWGLFASGTSKKRWIWIGLLGLQVLGLITTFSRSAWAAAVAGVGILLLPVFKKWISKPFRIPKALIATIVIALVVVPFFISNSYLRTRLFTAFTPTQVNEFSWRVIIWNYAIPQMIRHPILGLGTSTIDNTIAHIQASSSVDSFSTHNLYIDIAYQRGLISLALFLLFTFFIFRSALRIYSKSNNPNDKKLVLGLMAGVVAFLVSGIGIAAMSIENIATMYWLLFGIVITWEHYVFHINSHS
jgi:hypothetical protein